MVPKKDEKEQVAVINNQEQEQLFPMDDIPDLEFWPHLDFDPDLMHHPFDWLDKEDNPSVRGELRQIGEEEDKVKGFDDVLIGEDYNLQIRKDLPPESCLGIHCSEIGAKCDDIRQQVQVI